MTGSIILITIMVVLIILNTPITFTLGITGIIYFLLFDISLEQFIIRLAGGVDIFTLLAAPLFIFAGNVMNKTGITNRIFDFANSMVGHIRGGLGHVNVLSSMMFAGMSGSALADAAGLGNMEIKAMTDANYDLEFSTAVTAASAVIGPIIPPSNVMILYGITAGVAISDLFIGGIIPGITMGIALMGMVYYYSIKRNYPKGDKFSLKEFIFCFRRAILSLFTIIIILGGILGGVFTATEAGGIAAFYAIFISVFVYKDLNLKDLWEVIFETAKSSGVILLLISTANILGWCLVFERAPQAIATFLLSVTESKIVILMLFSVLYLLMGMILEASAIIVTTIPIMVPVFNILGIDLVFIGVLASILMSIGTITPPVGTVMFVLCKMTGLSIEKFTRVIIPWLLLHIALVILFIIFPQLITFLPSLR